MSSAASHLSAPVTPAPADSRLEQLLGFVCYRMLGAASAQLWWVLAGATFSYANLLLLEEVWPNTSRAEPCLVALLLTCLALLPWLLARTAGRIAQYPASQGWRLFWRLVLIGCYAVAWVSLVPLGFIVVLFVLNV